MVAVVAAAARLALAVVSFVIHQPWLIPDEGQYVDLAATVASGRPAERWAPGYGQSLYDATWVFVAPLRALFDVFGAHRLVGQVWAASLGVGAAVATALAVRRFLRPEWALAAGLIVALFPSQLLWSSVVLRESAVWFALALVGLSVALGARGRGWSLVWPAVLASTALVCLGLLRPQTLVAASWSLAAAALLVRTRQYVATAVGGVAIAAVAPVMTGFGVFGLAFVLPVAGDTAEVRGRLAEGASSAFVQTADDRDAQLDPGVRHLPRGLVAVTLRPFPWEEATSSGIALARVENFIWAMLYALAAVGVILGRKLWPLMAYPLLLTVVIMGTAAVTQGNLGTAFRHRSQVLWALAVLAVIGLHELGRRRIEKHHQQDGGLAPAVDGIRERPEHAG